MDGPTPALPPHFAVRAYLRQHPLNASEFFSDFVRGFGWDCGNTYFNKSAGADEIAEAANSFEDRLSPLQPFAVVKTHTKGSSALPSREKRGVCAFFMQPIGLMQMNRCSGDTYVEQALLLRTLQAEYRRKRATFGFGTGTLVLTQHLLERVYDRTDIHHDQFTTLLHGELTDLMRGVALSTVGSIWVDAQDEHGPYRIGEVPYSNGLIKVEVRTIYGDVESGTLGYWVGMHSKRGMPFVNPWCMQEESLLPERPELLGIDAVCGVTYLNVTQLRSEQLDYYYTFEALKSEIGSETLDACANHYCAPHFPNERPPELFISRRAEKLLHKTRQILKGQSLHPSRSFGLGIIVQSEYERSRRQP